MINRYRFCSLIICAFFVFGSAVFQVRADEYFDSYGVVPWSQEKARLDNFGFYLKKNEDMNGYIAYVVGRNEKKSTIKKRVTRAANYVKNHFGLDSSRIIIVPAGRGEKTKIILQPLSKGSPPLKF